MLLNCTCFIPDHIPEDLRDPFYTDQYDQEHIKPPVIRLLLSCELYCRVCSLILKTEQAASLQSHLSVIQALSRKGIYVVESDDTPVTEGDLACVPIKMVSKGTCERAFNVFLLYIDEMTLLKIDVRISAVVSMTCEFCSVSQETKQKSFTHYL